MWSCDEGVTVGEKADADRWRCLGEFADGARFHAGNVACDAEKSNAEENFFTLRLCARCAIKQRSSFCDTFSLFNAQKPNFAARGKWLIMVVGNADG